MKSPKYGRDCGKSTTFFTFAKCFVKKITFLHHKKTKKSSIKILDF